MKNLIIHEQSIKNLFVSLNLSSHHIIIQSPHVHVCVTLYMSSSVTPASGQCLGMLKVTAVLHSELLVSMSPPQLPACIILLGCSIEISRDISNPAEDVMADKSPRLRRSPRVQPEVEYSYLHHIRGNGL